MTLVPRSLLRVRPGLRLLGAVGAILLLAATVVPVLRYPPPPGIADAFDLARTGWERTAIVLPLLAALGALGLLARGPAARVGRGATALAGLVAVGVGVLVDRPGAAPDLTVGAGGVTSNLAPGSGPGWYLELAGGVLLLAVGLALLATERGAEEERRVADEEAAGDGAAAADPPPASA